MAYSHSLILLSALLTSVSAVPSSYSHVRRSQYPFSNIVAFGDELSDNGNGSYARGINGNTADVYRTGASTNAPVAVSYLSSMLDLSLIDHAFGGCCGGDNFGATLNSSYTSSPAGAPSLDEQIMHYASSGAVNAASSMGFVWIGQNDLSEHTDPTWLDDPRNTWFVNNYTEITVSAVESLLEMGLPHVLVANLYPKQMAPVTQANICGESTDCVETLGQVIQQANSALRRSLASFGDKVIYYDAFSFLTSLAQNAVSYGFTQPLTTSCDDHGRNCREDGYGTDYFWLNMEQPTTRVHKLIARDMKRTIDTHLN